MLTNCCFFSLIQFFTVTIRVSVFPCRDPSEEKIVENFLEEQGEKESKKIKILKIVRGMGKGFFFLLDSYIRRGMGDFFGVFDCSTFS